MTEKCQVCKKKRYTVLHHVDYKFNDTIPVCLKCHQTIHNNKNHKYHPKNNAINKGILLNFRTYEELLSCKLDFEKQEKITFSFPETIEKLINIVYNKTNIKKNKNRILLLKRDIMNDLFHMRNTLEKEMGKRLSYSKTLGILLEVESGGKKIICKRCGTTRTYYGNSNRTACVNCGTTITFNKNNKGII